MLNYLSTRINIGQVYSKDIESENVSSTWEVTKLAEFLILRVIEIFENIHLILFFKKNKKGENFNQILKVYWTYKNFV